MFILRIKPCDSSLFHGQQVSIIQDLQTQALNKTLKIFPDNLYTYLKSTKHQAMDQTFAQQARRPRVYIQHRPKTNIQKLKQHQTIQNKTQALQILKFLHIHVYVTMYPSTISTSQQNITASLRPQQLVLTVLLM